MLAKKLFALCREFPVAGVVSAAKLRFAPWWVNHSHNLNSVWQKNTILLIGGVELARIAILEQAIF